MCACVAEDLGLGFRVWVESLETGCARMNETACMLAHVHYTCAEAVADLAFSSSSKTEFVSERERGGGAGGGKVRWWRLSMLETIRFFGQFRCVPLFECCYYVSM